MKGTKAVEQLVTLIRRGPVWELWKWFEENYLVVLVGEYIDQIIRTQLCSESCVESCPKVALTRFYMWLWRNVTWETTWLDPCALREHFPILIFSFLPKYTFHFNQSCLLSFFWKTHKILLDQYDLWHSRCSWRDLSNEQFILSKWIREEPQRDWQDRQVPSRVRGGSLSFFNFD